LQNKFGHTILIKYEVIQEILHIITRVKLIYMRLFILDHNPICQEQLCRKNKGHIIVLFLSKRVPPLPDHIHRHRTTDSSKQT